MKIGAHMSIAGGIQNCFKRSYDIGGNSLQIFSKSPRGWNYNNNLSQENINIAKENFVKFKQDWGIIHSVYLINLAKPFLEAQRDRDSVIDDFQVAKNIGFPAVNIHLGKYGEQSKQVAMQNMSDNIAKILEIIGDYGVKFVFENTAGQGTEIGWNFEELGEFYDLLKKNNGKKYIENNINFCIDTAHAWGAGYDLANWDYVLSQFEECIGVDKLYCFHINDSKAINGSRLDRHANLGKGFIGLPIIANIVKWANENKKPVILETPDDTLWSKEIQMLKKIVDGTFSDIQINDFHQQNYKTEYLKKFEQQAKNQDSLF